MREHDDFGAAPLFRTAKSSDISQLLTFILDHGQNPWNYLPKNEVKTHLNGIESGETFAIIAEVGGRLAGFVTYLLSVPISRPLPDLDSSGYVAEAVVHRDCSGRGIGSQLLEQAKQDLISRGVTSIYLKRHEENQASAGMMRKAGFVEVETFFDPEVRPNGSRRTTICRFKA